MNESVMSRGVDQNEIISTILSFRSPSIMAELPLVAPERIGLSPERIERASVLLKRWTDSGEIPAAGLCIGRSSGAVAPRFYGKQSPEGADAIRPDSLFLLASITKPVTATAVLMLVERGQMRLDDPVALFVPAFGKNGKADVCIRHLLTHTSGLPDMTPSNLRFRAEHRPLDAFIEEVCGLPLAFPPGTQVSYQSMGFAMLAEVVHQVAGTTLREFLERELFAPLGMTETSLGWRPETRSRIAMLRVLPEQAGKDWSWNSPYWLGLGVPWGGLISTPADLARLCRFLLSGGVTEGGTRRLLGAATVRAMTSNQLETMPLIPEADRRCRPWGLGWRLAWQAHPESFGDFLSPDAFGHWGASGTLLWVDPAADLFCILLTTQPLGDHHGRYHPRISNIVATALT
jgi:CubicO group peptidase (beta-lactamase class C family)